MFGFKKKSIKDNIKDFDTEFQLVQIVSVQYLTKHLKQIFLSSPYKETFKDNPRMPQVLAIEMVKYLTAQDPKEDVWDKDKIDEETYRLAKESAPKWADDIMKYDLHLCKLIVQTLRLMLIYNTHIHERNNENFYKTQLGKRILDLLKKYGSLIAEEPNPKSYSKLLKEWAYWSKVTGFDDLK